MKEKLNRYLRQLREGLSGILRLHPVETALLLYGCIGCILVYELDLDDLSPRLVLVPLFFLLALVVCNLGGAWRKVYWVCWAPLVPLSLWSGIEGWIETLTFFLTLGVLAPLALLMCRRAIDNERFIADAVVWLRSAVLAVFFANVALGLFAVILFSTTYIFGLEGAWIDHVWIYAMIFAETFCVGVLFLVMSDCWRGAECSGNRIVEVLLDYIVTPALVIYGAILYLYIVRILLLGSLPRGGVAYMVFGFMLLSIVVQALQSMLPQRRYGWFFNRFGLISLPVLVLFWVGVGRRVAEYGLTEPRVLLLVSGGVMTLCMLLFLGRRTGCYLYVCLAAFVAFGAIAYVPALHPERIALRAQTNRAYRLARKLDLLAPDGMLDVARFAGADSLRREEYSRLHDALEYVALRDTAALMARFGIADTDGLSPTIPEEPLSVYLWAGDARRLSVAGYTRMYYGFESGDEVPRYRHDADTLRIVFGPERPDYVIADADLLRTQFRKIGVPEGETPTVSKVQAATADMLTFSDDEVMILFRSFEVVNLDTDPAIEYVDIGAVLTR